MKDFRIVSLLEIDLTGYIDVGDMFELLVTPPSHLPTFSFHHLHRHRYYMKFTKITI